LNKSGSVRTVTVKRRDLGMKGCEQLESLSGCTLDLQDCERLSVLNIPVHFPFVSVVCLVPGLI
jgi:hypothetical protein